MRAIALSGLSVLLIAASVAANDLDPLAELTALGDALADTGPEAGGSIRAKRDADLTAMKRLDAPENVEARVEAVKVGRFPTVALRLKVLRPAKSGSSKAIERNAELVVVPKLKITDGDVALDDAATLVNAGAFYLQKGDKVAVRLGAQRGKIWEADYIERK